MNRFMSVFSKLLQLFPRLEFERAVTETKAERYARGFSSWERRRGRTILVILSQEWAPGRSPGNSINTGVLAEEVLL